MKALVNEDVILDVLTGREPFRAAAENIFLQAATNSFEASVSASSLASISEFVYSQTNNLALTKGAIEKLLCLFRVQDVTQADCVNATASQILRFDDALVVFCASRGEADVLVTRDSVRFEGAPIKVVSPEQFLGMLKA